MAKESMPWYGKKLEEIQINTVWDVEFFDDDGNQLIDESGDILPMVQFKYSSTGATWAPNKATIHYTYNEEFCEYVFSRIAQGASFMDIQKQFTDLTGKIPNIMKNVLRKYPDRYNDARNLRIEFLKEEVEGVRDFKDCDKNSKEQSQYYDRLSRFKFMLLTKMSREYRDRTETNITSDTLAQIIIRPKDSDE